MMFAQEGITRNISSDNNTIMFSGAEEESSVGLARFRSAPSSFFASFLDGLKVNGTNSDSSVGEDEADKMFSGFIGCNNGDLGNIGICDLNELQQESCDLKQERTTEYVQQQQNGIWNSGNCSSNLLRQSSSPAGLFAGLDATRQMGSFRPNNGIVDESISTSSGLSNHMNFTSPPSATSRFMPSIAEDVDEHIGRGSPKDGQLRNGTNANIRSYVPSFGSSSWNDPASPNSLKRNRDGDMKMFSSFNGLENQNGLIHHLSMPKTSSEMAAVENYLEFQQDDGVPCKIRAKRGFATHPRSIAERVRRNRISERMKKLQELFPDMDKQTNTAEMLDLAVDYIKDLQKQVQTLTDLKNKCTCPSKKSPAS